MTRQQLEELTNAFADGMTQNIAANDADRDNVDAEAFERSLHAKPLDLENFGKGKAAGEAKSVEQTPAEQPAQRREEPPAVGPSPLKVKGGLLVNRGSFPNKI